MKKRLLFILVITIAAALVCFLVIKKKQIPTPSFFRAILKSLMHSLGLKSVEGLINAWLMKVTPLRKGKSWPTWSLRINNLV